MYLGRHAAKPDDLAERHPPADHGRAISSRYFQQPTSSVQPAVDLTALTMHAHRMSAIGELTAGVAHDFKNVLQTLTSTLELLDRVAADPAAVRRIAATALRATDRGTGLAGRLLSFARQEEQHVSAVDVRDAVTDIAETLAGTVGMRVKLEVVHLSGHLWPAAIDLSEFELALINLGINARDAMPDGGSIRLFAKNVTLPNQERRQRTKAPPGADRRGPAILLPGGDYVAVAVADTGHGMDETTLSCATVPFFTTKPRGKGTGLGLAMVQRFANRYGGTLRLTSRPGAGTTAEIWLPRAPALRTAPIHQLQGHG